MRKSGFLKTCLLVLPFISFSFPRSFAAVEAAVNKPSPVAAAAEKGQAAAAKKEDAKAAVENSIVLKMMVVNPSDKFKQTYSMKAYLPEEVQPEYILDKEDLELGYDAEKKAYYVTKELELDPGQSLVKAIEIKDIWLISDKEMQELSSEARSLYGKLKGTKYEMKGRLLLSNVEVLLTQIFERQNDDTTTPEEHISIYRDNKNKIRDIELDLVAMRRLVVTAQSEAGMFGKGLKGTLAPDNAWDKDAAEKTSGAIPAWVAWRIIFGILSFLGILTFIFFWTWQLQLRTKRGKEPGRVKIKKEKEKEKEKEKDVVSLEDLLGPSYKPTNSATTQSRPDNPFTDDQPKDNAA